MESLFTVTQEGLPKVVVLTATGETALAIADIFIGNERSIRRDAHLSVRHATADESAAFFEFSKIWQGEVSLAAMTWEQ
jgi:hypothetical protein